MSAISPHVRFAVGDFLRTLATIKPGEKQPEAALEHPKMMASTVLLLLSGGDESQLDLGDIAIAALARATIALCEDPRNRDKIAEFQSASDAWAHVNRALGQE